MIDRDLLQEMGFQKGHGWDHEVWVYEGMFWVYFGGDDDEVDGVVRVRWDIPRTTFFTAFIREIRRSVIEHEENT